MEAPAGLCHNSAMLRGSLLAAALLALVGLGAQQSSGASASPPRNGRIAYVHVGNGSRFQIYAMTPTGTRRRHLTNSRRYSSFAPSYSPNGKLIVFVRAFKQADLWTMHANGTRERRLTRTKKIREIDPTWSPDGKTIAFAVESPAALRGIWLVGADGHDRHRLTNGSDTHPSWSPDGAQVAFSRSGTDPEDVQIYVVPAAGGTPSDLTNDPGSAHIDPAWSPDGGRILFSSDRTDPNQLDLWVLDLRAVGPGTSFARVTNTPSRDEGGAAWSPDGRRIVYSGMGSFHGASSSQIYVSTATGSQRRILTHACGECAFVNEEPSWQPLPR
jgi:Tol biopolymer transport system component